jgi:CubicO group peptidase (beta-lactamase class C family)
MCFKKALTMRFCLLKYVFTISLAVFHLSEHAFAQPAPALLFSSDSINNLNKDIRNDQYGKISSLIIYHKNRLVSENYFGFTQATTLHQISSVTKSVTSLAVGICIDKGFIPSVDIEIAEYFPEYSRFFVTDPLKSKITLRHLLAQTSGFNWDEWTIHYSYAGNPLIELSHKPVNWIPIILNLPMSSSPGEIFNYNSACSELIKEMVSRSSGLSFKNFVEKYLFDELNISTYYWDSYPENDEPAWGGISLTTRDMAKIGLLVYNGGKWGNKRIISEEWIRKSSMEIAGNESIGYGYHWWIGKQPDGNPLIFAAGYGDQYVYIAPDKNIVVAINAKNFTDHKWDRNNTDLINRIIRAYSKPTIAKVEQPKI